MLSRVFIFYSSCEIADGKVLVSNHQPNLSLTGVASHPSAEASEHSEVRGVLDIRGRRIAVDDNGLIVDQ